MIPSSRLLWIGFFLVLIGAVLPFIIMIRLLESTYLLNFIAFASSTIGIFLGVLGTATYVGNESRKAKWRSWRDGSQE